MVFMNEFNHPLKEDFLKIVENDPLMFAFKPKRIWQEINLNSCSIQQQTYSLIKELVKYEYLIIHYEDNEKLYSETEKLAKFRQYHCEKKAKETLEKRLEELQLEIIIKNSKIKDIEIIKKNINTIDFCFNNYISLIKKNINKLNNEKEIIIDIIKNLQHCTY